MLEKAQVENTLPRSCTTWKMMEWKMHTMENNKKCKDWKMTEYTQPEYDRMKNAQPRNARKGMALKMIYNACMYIMENVRKITHWKMLENHNWKMH